MATPHAAGSVALLLQAKSDLTPNQTKWALLTTALELGENPNAQGSGRGDVFAAYQKIISETPPDLPDPPEPEPPGPLPPPSGCLEQVMRVFRGG
jgi:subtilisin family serine protease